jgi:hypothetical protein
MARSIIVSNLCAGGILEVTSGSCSVMKSGPS